MNDLDENKVIEQLKLIENEIKAIKNDNISKLVEEEKFTSYFLWISTLSIIIIFSYYLNIEEEFNFLRNFLFWGSIGGKLTLSILILNYISRFDSIEYFFKLKFTKLISGLIFSAIILYSNSKASIILNDIFSISATNLPYSLTFTTAFYSINYISSTFVIIASIPLCLLILLELNYYINEKRIQSSENIWIIIILIFSLIFTLGLQNREFSDNSIRYKAYQLALMMDFDSKNSCEGIPNNLSVAYIGSNQQKVIINPYISENNKPLSFEDFLMNSKNNSINLLFPVQPCINNIKINTTSPTILN